MIHSAHILNQDFMVTPLAKKYWDEKNDVLAVGSYSSLEERDKVQIKEANNISYTMLNYAYGTNGMPIPSGKDYLINVWPTDLSINDPIFKLWTIFMRLEH